MSIRLIVLLGIFTFSVHGVIGSAAEAVVFEPEVEQAEPAQSARAWLFLAAKRGDLAKINELIESGSDVNARDEDGMTPLMIAVKHGAESEVLSVLIEGGAKVDARDVVGNSALLYAARHSMSVSVFDILLQAGAGVNVRNERGETPLMIAVENGTGSDVINRLFQAQANVDARDIQGRTALMHGLIANAEMPVIERLLEEGADVNAREALQVTPMMFAARYGRSVETIELLLDHGARIRDRVPADYLPYTHNGLSGDTVPSFAAAYNTNLDVVRFLIENWGDVNEAVLVRGRLRKGEPIVGMKTTLLILAARSNPSPAVLELFLDAGVDPMFKTVLNETALYFAKKNPGLKGTDAFWKLNDASF